jgi:hypothetical protein
MMAYPWPFEQPDPRLQKSLDIALGYLESTTQNSADPATETTCARVILDAWLEGKRRHPLWLANKAIVAIETKQPLLQPVPIRFAGPRFLS